MAQSDMVISDQVGASFLPDLNSVIAALATNSSGATEPATTYAFQVWADTTADRLKIRNAANDAWVSVLVLSTGAPVSGVASGPIISSGLTQATARMLGRSAAGTGAVEEISLGASMELSSGSLNVKDAGIGAAKLSGAQAGSAPVYGARAWCVFNGSTAGTNAPTAGGNVSTVTRNSVGNWTVNLATAMPTSTFAALAMSNRSSGTGNETGLSIAATTTSTVTIVNYGYDGAYRDSSLISVAVFG